MKKIFSYIPLSILICLAVILLLYPDKYLQVAFEGFKVFALGVLPSLFPFLFLTGMITKLINADRISRALNPLTKKIFRCSGISAYVFLMSVISGYPVGSKIISSLYSEGKLSKDECTRASTFTSTAGPIFIVGTVATVMLKDKSVGYIILLSHILSAIICGIIFRFYGKQEYTISSPLQKEKSENILGECMADASLSILQVGGFICIFYLLSAILLDFNLLVPIQKIVSVIFSPLQINDNCLIALSTGIIEMTGSCRELALALPLKKAAPLCAMIISFGGLCTIFQSITYLKKCKANIKIFMFAKLLQSVLSFGICYLFICI